MNISLEAGLRILPFGVGFPVGPMLNQRIVSSIRSPRGGGRHDDRGLRIILLLR